MIQTTTLRVKSIQNEIIIITLPVPISDEEKKLS